MRIVIVGQKWLGVQVLNACTAAGHEVVAVVAPSGDRLALAAHCLGLPLVCLLYTSPSPRDGLLSRMPSSA